MTYPVNMIVSRATVLLNDLGMVQWSQGELVDWLNEGQLALVKIHPDANTKTATLQLVAGAKQTNPADCIEIIDMRRNNAGGSITPCDRRALDTFSPNWMSSPTSSTVKHYMDDPQPDTFYVFPAQNTTPGTVLLTYSAIPATAVVGGNITIRDVYADNLVNYLMYRAFSKDAEGGNAERAIAYFNLFKG